MTDEISFNSFDWIQPHAVALNLTKLTISNETVYNVDYVVIIEPPEVDDDNEKVKAFMSQSGIFETDIRTAVMYGIDTAQNMFFGAEILAECIVFDEDGVEIDNIDLSDFLNWDDEQ